MQILILIALLFAVMAGAGVLSWRVWHLAGWRVLAIAVLAGLVLLTGVTFVMPGPPPDDGLTRFRGEQREYAIFAQELAETVSGDSNWAKVRGLIGFPPRYSVSSVVPLEKSNSCPDEDSAYMAEINVFTTFDLFLKRFWVVCESISWSSERPEQVSGAFRVDGEPALPE